MEFLSEEWVAALDAAATATDHPALEGVSLVVEQAIVDGPEWRVEIHGGRVRVHAGPYEGPLPVVRFTTDADTAAAINRGDRAALDAFVKGAVRATGDLRALLEQHRALAAVDDVFAGVRARTTWT